MIARYAVASAFLIGSSLPTPSIARAQQRDSLPANPPVSAVFRGRVVRRGAATPVAGADVWVISADRHESTDSSGVFRFDGLAPGLQLVEVRHVGLDVEHDTIGLSSDHENVRTYALGETSTTLDTVHTIAGANKYLSPRLRAFEERRLSGQGGHFISDSVMRQNENSNLADIGSRLPGLMVRSVFLKDKGFVSALISTRKPCAGLVLLHSPTCSIQPNCFVAIYLDGVLQYSTTLGTDPPDLSREFPISELAGAEYYAGGAASPAGMHSNDDGCGSLWLWTRER
jgi:carboxypeptidase family protein